MIAIMIHKKNKNAYQKSEVSKQENLLCKCAIIGIKMPHFDWLLHGNDINIYKPHPFFINR